MRLLLVALALLAGVPALAQPAPARHWVFFADRDAAAGAIPSAAPPSERAVARRALRGTSPAWADAPVAARYVAALRALGVDPVVESRWLNAVTAPLTPEARAAVEKLPFVRAVRPVARVERASMAAEPAAPGVPLARGGLDPGPSALQLRLVGADVALAAGYDGAGVRLGFLDTLFDFAHPALAHVAAGGRLVGVQDFTGGQPQANYHGLATTSIALGADAGDLVGPAHGAEVLAGTTEYAPTETPAEEDFFIAGLEWMEAQGVDVVSVSLGYHDFDPAGPGPEDYTFDDLDGDTTPFTRAVDRAAALGVLVVVAAGNDGNNAWGHIAAPADADSALAVGSVDPDSARSSFSGYGPTADGRVKPDVAALGRGVWIAQPGGGYSFGQGTSFAAPMAAGVAAQLLQADPALAPMDVIRLLRQTASQAAAPDTLLGYGILDASAALVAAGVEPWPDPGATGLLVAPNVAAPGERLMVVIDGASGALSLDVVDLLGRVVLTVYDRVRSDGGRYGVPLTVPPLAAGTYVVRLRLDERTETRVLVVR
jgi:serine protease AprX